MAIWLTLPDQTMNGRELAMDAETDAATRYVLGAETVAVSTAIRGVALGGADFGEQAATATQRAVAAPASTGRGL